MKANLLLVIIVSLLFSSCYTLQYSVGTGAKGTEEIEKRNDYIVEGAIPIKTHSPTEMAAGATDYDVKIWHTPWNIFVMLLTWGLYTPTTIVVTK